MRDVPENNASIREKLQWINEALFSIEKNDRKLGEITDEQFESMPPEKQREIIEYSQELQDKYRRLLTVKKKLSLDMELIKKDISDTHTPDNINDFPPMNPEVKDIKSNFISTNQMSISYRQADWADYKEEEEQSSSRLGLIISCESRWESDGLGDSRWAGDMAAMWSDEEGEYGLEEVELEDGYEDIKDFFLTVIENMTYTDQISNYEWGFEHQLGDSPDTLPQDNTAFREALIALANSKSIGHKFIEDATLGRTRKWKVRFY